VKIRSFIYIDPVGQLSCENAENFFAAKERKKKNFVVMLHYIFIPKRQKLLQKR